jgi:long-chain fatty acid transport protein
MPARVLSAVLVLLATASLARAAGFYLQEESAAGLGRAYAGAPVMGDTPSIMHYNPAGLTLLDPRLQVEGALYGIFPDSTLSDRGSTIRTPGTFGETVRAHGNDGGNPYGPTPLANLFIAGTVPYTDDRVRLGFGMTSPFGLVVAYDHGWFGRYDSTRSILKTFDFTPTIAVRATDWLSLGASLDVEYARAVLEQAIPNPAQNGGPTAFGDGRGRVKGDDTSVGYTIGALIQPTSRAKLGVGWRYGISHHLVGALDISGLSGIARPGNAHVGGSAYLDEPNIVMIGGSYDLTSYLTLLGSVNWYGWHVFREIRIVADDPKIAPLVDKQDFQDTVGLAGGLEWAVTSHVRVRGGFQYDPTPTVDRFRNTRMPDGDRYLLAFGGSYRFSDHFEWTFGYMHTFVNEANVNRVRTIYEGTPLASTSITRATASTGIDLVSVALLYRF